jgi:ferredoxin
VIARLIVTIERVRCQGAGMCVFHAPETFDISDDDTMVVLLEGRDDVNAIRAAEEACPNRVITLNETVEE